VPLGTDVGDFKQRVWETTTFNVLAADLILWMVRHIEILTNRCSLGDILTGRCKRGHRQQRFSEGLSKIENGYLRHNEKAYDAKLLQAHTRLGLLAKATPCLVAPRFCHNRPSVSG
jgi:hypothetical protein